MAYKIPILSIAIMGPSMFDLWDQWKYWRRSDREQR